MAGLFDPPHPDEKTRFSSRCLEAEPEAKSVTLLSPNPSGSVSSKTSTEPPVFWEMRRTGKSQTLAARPAPSRLIANNSQSLRCVRLAAPMTATQLNQPAPHQLTMQR